MGIPGFLGFPGPVLVGTDSGDTPAARIVHAFDISAAASQPAGYWNPPRYEDPSWTLANLGSVFGVAIDDAGNIYLSRTSLYPQHVLGSLGGGSGGILKLGAATGAASLLVSLPQGSTGPGLGNIAWSCAHHSLYATDFEDGRIYRIDPAAPPGNQLRSAWDFATDTIAPGDLPEAGDPDGVVPLGERVWAVAPGSDRLFFSVWNRDLGNQGGAFNAVWSVSLDVAGDPMPGTSRLELVLDNSHTLAPISDLSFDGACCLYVAQRTMIGFTSSAHGSDLLKFCFVPAPGGGGAWQPSGLFEVGHPPANPHMCSGGVGVDLGTTGRVWSTADTLQTSPPVYGLEGLPQTGGSTPDGLDLDMDGDATNQPDFDKEKQGSCEVASVVGPHCFVRVDDVECVLGPDGFPTGQYSITLDLHNGSGLPVDLLLLPSLGAFVPLAPALADGMDRTFKLTVTGNGGDTISIPIGLYDGATNCCGTKAEVELPNCDCIVFTDVEVDCIQDPTQGVAQYSVTFTVHNVAPWTAAYLFLIPPAGAPFSFSPSFANVFPLPGGGTWTPGTPLTLTFFVPPVVGPNGQWTITVPVSIHTLDLVQCCSALLVLHGTYPCGSPCGPDLNGDGVVDGGDLAILIAAWGGPDGCADLNGDGIVNGADLAILLGAWG